MPIQVNDAGTQIVLKVREGARRLDLSAATSKRVVLTKPDGNEVVREAGFLTDGRDGALVYTTLPGEMDQPGLWQVQAELVLGTWSGRSSRAALRVEA
ncbi:MAG: hypothetical protein HUU06_06700 [Planctomycetaceae bacterium]|nr:hypothetical protein [Planctomycetota bacterium]NUN52460.1 hypothetical protein [Planctomycetaceae bacterium]